MRTIAFFNNKGGVGKTTLVYHLAFMLRELGHRVLLADLDPQANLTSMCLDEDRVEALWSATPRQTVFSSIALLKRGVGDVVTPHVEEVVPGVNLIPGDLAVSEFEDDLSSSWPECLDRKERGFRVTTAFSRLIRLAAKDHSADYTLVDVGPNLGAINRTALISSDYVIIPAAPDLFSVQGLENVGPRLRQWRGEWQERIQKRPKELDFDLPPGSMQPVGYVVSRYSVHEGRQTKAFVKWLSRLPDAYRTKVQDLPSYESAPQIDTDEMCLAQLKDYRSLMPMAQEARKPMFALRPGDGAIGGHQAAVQRCFQDFKILADKIIAKTGEPRN